MRRQFFLPIFFTVFVIFNILIAGCTSKSTPDQSNVIPTIIPTVSPILPVVSDDSAYGEARDIIEANNKFTFDLYKKLRNSPRNGESNLFFSPFSMSSAFAITYEGARGTTADEIASVFHFPTKDKILRRQYSGIITAMNRNDSSYHLSMANALWTEKTHPFHPDYVQTVQQYYGANLTSLDFNNSPDDSRLIINNWVDHKTEGKITNLLSKGAVNPLTQLVITNALYFNGTWESQFNPEDTYETNFTVGREQTVRVQMMNKRYSENWFRYFEDEQLQVVEIPYTNETGRKLSMLVILPTGNNLSTTENSLDLKNFTGLRNGLQYHIVNIYLPKYRIENQYVMDSVLKEMGMPTAFSDSADFSGMDGGRNLSITSAVHKAYIDVNEKGTEAAAASKEELWPASPAPPKIYKFVADHPFIFMIEDEETGNILLMGRMMNPNE